MWPKISPHLSRIQETSFVDLEKEAGYNMWEANKAGRRQGAIDTEGESDDPNYISMFQCNVYLYEKVHVYECVEHGGYGMKLVFYFFNKLLVKVIQKMNTRECRSERTFLSSEQAFCRYKRTVYSRRRPKMIHVYTNVQMCIIK